MRCIRCGQAIPGGSQFCLKCGAPVPSTGPSSVQEVAPAAIATGRSGGPGKAVFIALAVLLVALAAAIGSVVHGRLANSTGPQSPTGPLASATAPAPKTGGMADATEHPYTSGGMANANVPANQGGGMANAVVPQGRAGGMANANSIPIPPIGMANAPSGAGPQNAQAPDNVVPYLQALARIEGERQQIDAQADAGLSRLQQTALKATIAMADPDGDRTAGKLLSDATAFIPGLVSQYVRLRGEIEGLRRSPGVPASCQNLQNDYAAAIDPWVKMGAPALAQQDRVIQENQKNPLTGSTDTNAQLQNAMPAMLLANQQSSAKLDAAQAELQMVCQSHHVTAPPPFPIKNTMQQGGGIASALP